MLFFACLAVGHPARAGDKQDCVVAHEQAQELRHASKLFDAREKLVTCSQSSCPALVRADCAPWLAEVEKALPSVVVSAHDGSGADIVDVRWFIDGVRMGELLDGEALTLDPGEHRFRFERAASQPIEEKVLIREGEKSRRLIVNFGAPGDIVGNRRASVWPYLLAGAGGVALGSFAYFGIKGKIDADNCHGQCSADQAEPVTNELRVADISLVSGLVLTAAAVWLLLSPPLASTKPVSGSIPRHEASFPRTLSSSVRCEAVR